MVAPSISFIFSSLLTSASAASLHLEAPRANHESPSPHPLVTTPTFSLQDLNQVLENMQPLLLPCLPCLPDCLLSQEKALSTLFFLGDSYNASMLFEKEMHETGSLAQPTKQGMEDMKALCREMQDWLKEDGVLTCGWDDDQVMSHFVATHVLS